MEKFAEAENKTSALVVLDLSINDTAAVGEINPSGHRQELQRNYGLWSICGLAITTGNTWLALGGSIVRRHKPPIGPPRGPFG